jgi:L,D-peptidoglycan transpeptidase YkuD (ErfK/YbiS/YcfS/YnhG family)
MADILVLSGRQIIFSKKQYRCAVGRNGLTHEKQEGDGATPVGRWKLKRLLYRADRMAKPATELPLDTITKKSGWCDDPNHPDYNTQITLPHFGRCEKLWREDHIYDLVVVLGYNDKPILAGAGSAIFLHVASPDFGPTEGCISLAMNDLLEILTSVNADSALEILDRKKLTSPKT